MRNGKFPLAVGGMITGLYALLMLINGVIFVTGAHASGWSRLFAVLLPAMLLAGAVICLVFRDGLEDHIALSSIAQSAVFLSVGMSVIATAIVPGAVSAVYENLRTWTPVDIWAWFGESPLWPAACVSVGLYWLCHLGITLADGENSPGYVWVREILVALILFVGFPFLHKLGWINPSADFPLPLFVFFCALYYPIFLLIRSIFDEEEILFTIFATIGGAVGIIPYFFLIYLLSGVFIFLYGFVLIAWNFVLSHTWLTVLFLFCFLGIAPYAIITKNSSGQVMETRFFEGVEGVGGIARVFVVLAIIALVIYGVSKLVAA